MRTRTLLVAGACLVSTSCRYFEAPTAPPPQEIVVRVTSGEQPLEGVVVSAGSGVPGSTARDGTVRLRIHGEEGAKVDLSVACPPGHAAPSSLAKVIVRRTNRTPQFDVPCKAVEHAIVVAFHTTGAVGVPILYLGREIARTDDAGYALVELEPNAGETLTFLLDTTDARFRSLRPQSPELSVLAPDGEETFALEQKFSEERPRVAAPRPRAPSGPISLNGRH